MSSRILRRFQGKDTFLEEFAGEENDNEPDLTGQGGVRRKEQNVNPFDLLNEDARSESDGVKDDENNDSGKAGDNGDCTFPEDTRQKKKNKKKKKKKKGKIGKSSESKDSFEEFPEEEVVCGEDGNDLPGCSSGGSQHEVPSLDDPSMSPRRRKSFKDFQELVKNHNQNCPPLLTINPRKLNVVNELKKIFGSKIVESDRRVRRSRGKGFMRHRLFIDAPKESWPPLHRNGLSMRMDRTDNGPLFVFTHNQPYQQVQKKFLAAVDSHQPDNIMAIINEHPYHVDALLQLSDFCKMNEDLQMAADLNERALYCLESAFHPMFSITRGECLLDYRRQENRAFYICLFRHMLFVGQRACYETALEICKALLILDFELDPLAVLLCIDFYALRTSNYLWLISAAMEWENRKFVSHLPNFAYSVALAHFHMDEPHTRHHSDMLLQNALIAFPSVLIPLLDMCSVHTDKRVLAHPFFMSRPPCNERSPLSWLMLLYVHRTYHEWKVPEVLPWLEKNVHAVLDRVDAGDPLVKEWAQRRECRYFLTPRNVLRHIILSDIKEVTGAVIGELNTPILSFDPLPPFDSVDLYPKLRHRVPFTEDSNALSLFFRSLLPNFNVNERVAYHEQRMNEEGPEADIAELGAAAQAAQAARGAGDTLRVSVAVLMDAIGAVLAQMGEARGNNNDGNYGGEREVLEPDSNEPSDCENSDTSSDSDIDSHPRTA